MVKTVKVLELVKDWSLWPRYEANDLDSTNVKRLKEAIDAGVVLPPIIADAKSYRIIDGMHRAEAYRLLFGDAAEASVEFRDYKNEKEMFLEAARLNAEHGLPLTPKDRVHVALTAKRKKIPLAAIADALGMTKESLKFLENRRTATTNTGEKVPLSAGAMDLAGKKLTKKQEHYARTANGMLPIVNARLLLNALRANSYPLTENEIFVLHELKDEIERVLAISGV